METAGVSASIRVFAVDLGAGNGAPFVLLFDFAGAGAGVGVARRVLLPALFRGAGPAAC